MRWLAYHIFYHDDLDRVLIYCLLPLIKELFASDIVDSFFYIRYNMGGPHIRLRVRLLEEKRYLVRSILDRVSEEFFSKSPSMNGISDSEILKMSQALQDDDPFGDVEVYPNNSVVECDFFPEIERYGGKDALVYSLNFFMISSVDTMCWLAKNASVTRGKRLSYGYRLVARQALGFAGAAGVGGLIDSYINSLWAGNSSLLEEKALKHFEERRKSLKYLLDAELESYSRMRVGRARNSGESLLGKASARLGRLKNSIPPSMWTRIATSQIHMTCNRLGLTNIEEVYIGYLLKSSISEKTTMELQDIEDEFFSFEDMDLEDIVEVSKRSLVESSGSICK